MQDPVDPDLRFCCDEEVGEDDEHPAPVVQACEEGAGAVGQGHESSRGECCEGVPEERDCDRPDDHAPGAEGAEHEYALPGEPEDEADAAEEAEQVAPPEPGAKARSPQHCNTEDDGRDEGGETNDRVAESKNRTLP